MKSPFLLTCLLAATSAVAQGNPVAAPDHAADYARLDPLVGRWTLKGKEQDFLETCEWYQGRFHVVCHSESKRKDGSKGIGISILSFVPGQGYVYTGIGSSGRYETLERGTFTDGKIVFTTTAKENGKSIATRISIGPPNDAGFPFVVDTSSDGGSWTVVDSIEYVKLP